MGRGSLLLWALAAAAALASLPPLHAASLACIVNPCIHGICIDSINRSSGGGGGGGERSSYSCYCSDGYTGAHCQTNWDECWSSPCRNGATCHDAVAAFNCTCPEGFTGETCDENVDECGSNPCLNNATCVDADNGYFCRCLPGYSGVYCEVDAAVCNASEEERCYNGGFCLEGPGVAFSCLCLPGWTGRLCQTAVDECESAPCKNGGACIDMHATYACACPFGFTGKNCESGVELCVFNTCENSAVCVVEESHSVCYCVPDYHGDRCQFRYDECQKGPGCLNGGSCIDGVDSYSCSCPPEMTGRYCECLVGEGGELDCGYVRPTAESTAPAPASASASASVSLTAPETTRSFITSEESPASSVPSTTETEEETSRAGEEESTSSWTTEATETEGMWTTEWWTTGGSSTLEETSATESTSPQPSSSTSLEPWSSPSSPSSSSSLFPASDTSPASLVTTGGASETPTELTTTPDASSPGTGAAASTGPPTTPGLDCTALPCLNGGTCQDSPTGPRCECRLGWGGGRCDEGRGVRVAGVSGGGWLAHPLPSNTSAVVGLTLRTLADSGLLLFAPAGRDAYMALYLHQGRLKFQFSCGLKSVLLSQLYDPVNNGYPLRVTTVMELEREGSGECSAGLRVNESLVMSGEQPVGPPPPPSAAASAAPRRFSLVYLGGLPPHLDASHPLPLDQGATACLYDLTIDGEEREVYGEAVEGRGVSECSSLACLSSPCLNGATCLETAHRWHCLCPNGYVGERCESSVCRNNPCRFGGTCVQYPGSGFICLCPLGKHGLYCQQELEMGQGLFSSSVEGLSSYLAYPLPAAVRRGFELWFTFLPASTDQIALLLFVGQRGPHDPTSDHLALSFIKGYVVLTWNLGSGPRRIFTPHAVTDGGGGGGGGGGRGGGGGGRQSHLVKLGRVGQTAWLQVDNMPNVTGQSPGWLSQLNAHPTIYIGGHESRGFAGLPHDLPLHTGYAGCLWGLRLVVAGGVPLRLSDSREGFGRNVGQCSTSHCHPTACSRAGACLNHAATFTCLCEDGWFGPECSLSYNPCDSTRHNCSRGSTCVPLSSGYHCDCPVGTTGRFCQIEEPVSDVRFSGERSYLEVALPKGLGQRETSLEFQLRPETPQGLVLFVRQSHGPASTFLSLSLHGGILELRIAPVGGGRRSGEVVILRSGRVVPTGEWTKIKAGRYAQRIYLWVDGTVNSGNLLPGETLLPSHSPLYLGGVEDMSEVPRGAVAGAPVPFKGCLRALWVNGESLRLGEARGGRNLQDCDGTACGADVCANSGICRVAQADPPAPTCSCSKYYTGARCETRLSCKSVGCENGGRCVQSGTHDKCHCPVGWTDPFCTTEVEMGAAHFGGDGHLVVEPGRGRREEMVASPLSSPITRIYLNFTTAQPDGMILWTSQGEEYLGVGVEGGQVRVSWGKRGGAAASLLVPGPLVSDGFWHALALAATPDNNLTVTTDEAFSHQYAPFPPIATNGVFYLGGFPEDRSVATGSGGSFTEGFNGCIGEFSWGGLSSVTDFTTFRGENLSPCQP